MRQQQEVVQTARHMYEAGLTTGTNGNVSVRVDASTFAITPSATSYLSMTAEDVVGINADGERVWGHRKPSSEWALHTLFYRSRPDVGAVIHTHSPYATAAAVLGEAIPAILAEAVHILGGAVPVAPYVTFGTTQLAEAAVAACGSMNAVLLCNHGAVALGKDLPSALQCAAVLEETAKIYLLAKAAGTPKVIAAAELQAIYRAYGGYKPE